MLGGNLGSRLYGDVSVINNDRSRCSIASTLSMGPSVSLCQFHLMLSNSPMQFITLFSESSHDSFLFHLFNRIKNISHLNCD